MFPILTSKNLVENYDEVDLQRRYYNDHLKKIAKMCSIEQNLTSYVARHSFATQALLQGIPIKAISVMMGHSSVATTEVYLKDLPDKVIDDYHESICL